MVGLQGLKQAFDHYKYLGLVIMQLGKWMGNMACCGSVAGNR